MDRTGDDWLADWLREMGFLDRSVLYPRLYEEIEALVPAGEWLFDRRRFAAVSNRVLRGEIGVAGEGVVHRQRARDLAERGSELGLNDFALDVRESIVGWAERADAPLEAFATFVDQAGAARDAGDLDRAAELARRAAAIASDAGLADAEAGALVVLASVELDAGDLAAAAASSRRALELAESAATRRSAALLAAQAALEQEEPAEADRLFELAAEVARASEDRGALGLAPSSRSQIARERGDTAEALRLLDEAVRATAAVPDWDRVSALLGVGLSAAPDDERLPWAASLAWLRRQRRVGNLLEIDALAALLLLVEPTVSQVPPLGIEVVRLADLLEGEGQVTEAEQYRRGAFGALWTAHESRGAGASEFLDWIAEESREFSTRPDGYVDGLIEALVPEDRCPFDRASFVAASPARSVRQRSAPRVPLGRQRELARQFVDHDPARKRKRKRERPTRPRGVFGRVRSWLRGF